MFDRIHKIEEYFEGQIYDSAIEMVEEHFECEVSDLTEQQIDELQNWIYDHEYSVMASGFQSVISQWEDANLE